MIELKKKLVTNTEDTMTNVINEYLLSICESDEQLVKGLLDESKTISNMIEYISLKASNEPRKGNSIYIPREDIFGYAIHYFTEDDQSLVREMGSFGTVKKILTEQEILDQEKILEEKRVQSEAKLQEKENNTEDDEDDDYEEPSKEVSKKVVVKKEVEAYYEGTLFDYAD